MAVNFSNPYNLPASPLESAAKEATAKPPSVLQTSHLPVANDVSTSIIPTSKNPVNQTVKIASDQKPSQTPETQLATLYGPDGKKIVVKVGSSDASNLQSQGWGLTPGSYKPSIEKKQEVPSEATGSQEGTQEGAQGKEKEKPKDYSQDIVSLINQGYSDPQEIVDAINSTGGNISISDVNVALSEPTTGTIFRQNKILNQLEEDYNAHKEEIAKISSGNFVLSPTEQAQVDSINQVYDDLKKEQIKANQNYEAAVRTSMIRTGQQEFMSATSSGSYKQAVDSGLALVRKLDTDALNKVNELKNLFKESRLKDADSAYQDLTKMLKDKSDAIDKIYTTINSAYKDIRDFNYKAEKDALDYELTLQKNTYDQQKLAFDQMMQSEKFTYEQKQDAIKNMLASDKFTWEQKQAELNQYDKDRNFQLAFDKASALDNAQSRAEWVASGSPGTYSSFLIRKGSAQTKPPTADESNKAGYALRMKTAMDGVAKLSAWFANQGLLAQGFINSDTWANFLKSPEGKSLEQFERDFVNAKLRQESGAVISPSEFDNAKKQYFPAPGDSAAIIEQKLENMKTSLQGVIIGAGTALSDDFKNNYGSIKFDTLAQYEFFNPEKSKEIDALWDKFPNKTESEILDYFQNQSFSSVGGDTNSATLQRAVSREDGTNGGQCGRFVNSITGLGLGDSYENKMSKMDSSITKPEPGMVFVMPYKDTGHTGIIVSVNNDGTATVKDSNFSLDEKIKTHKIALSKITGLTKV